MYNVYSIYILGYKIFLLYDFSVCIIYSIKTDKGLLRWANGDDLNVTNWQEGQPSTDYPSNVCTLVVPGKGWVDEECTTTEKGGTKLLPLCEKGVESGLYFFCLQS